MEEKAFFTAKEREQLFALYKRLLQLSGDTLQKGDCHKLKIHLIKAVAEGNLPRNCFGMNPIIKDMQTAVIVAEEFVDFVVVAGPLGRQAESLHVGGVSQAPFSAARRASS